MNTKLNTKVTLSVGVVVVLAMLALGGPSVQAQTATTAQATVDSSITLSTKGLVSDPNGSVTVSGSVIITCRRVIDTTSATTPALVLLDFDFSQLKGTTGSGKNVKTFVTGGNHTDEIRPLQASDTVIVTVPYYDTTKDALSARTMLVTATLNFDVSTGKLTSGSLTIGNNVVTSTAVGSVTEPIQ
ncbi:MAG TPA: hypothetical protein VM656_15805 [Pyrinomonadaceae bacterium]|nr:hypothetical protein [Pyrinomonadaceae bacterium]